MFWPTTRRAVLDGEVHGAAAKDWINLQRRDYRRRCCGSVRECHRLSRRGPQRAHGDTDTPPPLAADSHGPRPTAGARALPGPAWATQRGARQRGTGSLLSRAPDAAREGRFRPSARRHAPRRAACAAHPSTRTAARKRTLPGPDRTGETAQSVAASRHGRARPGTTRMTRGQAVLLTCPLPTCSAASLAWRTRRQQQEHAEHAEQAEHALLRPPTSAKRVESGSECKV